MIQTWTKRFIEYQCITTEKVISKKQLSLLKKLLGQIKKNLNTGKYI